jgi:hypothetical protein
MPVLVPRIWLLLAVGWMAGLTAACGGSEFSPPLPIVQIILGIGDCGGLRVGEMCALDATAIDSGGSVVTDPSLRWSSSNPFVASVDFQGNVTGAGAGNATIVVQTTDSVIIEDTTLTVGEALPPPPDQTDPRL